MLNLDNTFTFTTPDETIETSAQTDQKQNEKVGDNNYDNDNEDEEHEFEFRLFSAPAGAGKPDPVTTGTTATTDAGKQRDEKNDSGTQKLRIRLRSPTPGPADLSEGRFVNPSRGWRYYFTTPVLSGSTEGEDEDADAALRRKQFEEVAVSGQHMLGWASLQPWVSPSYHLIPYVRCIWPDLTISQPGCHLPWRVIHLKCQHTKLPKDALSTTPPTNVYVRDPPEKTSPKSRKKPGKKRRVQLRKRVTAAEVAKEAEAEKRNRKNRERKIKRRQKARETKAAAVAASGGDPDTVMAGGDDDDASSQGGD